MKEYINAGELDERVELLTLKESGGSYAWVEDRRPWAKVELSTRKNVWSVHGIGATGVVLTMRRQPISLGNALRWRGHHCHITSISPRGSNHLTVEAALTVVQSCEDKYTGTRFPGVMTEEYHRHEQLEPMAINVIRHVLVTPKCIELTPGKLICVNGTDWPILTAHLLDPRQNEYIIERRVDT